MAITVGTPVQTTSSGSPSFSVTTIGSNCAILVFVCTRTSSDIITGVTFNGNSLARSQFGEDGVDGTYSYYLTATGAVSANVVVSQSSTVALGVTAIPLAGVDQTTMIDTSNVSAGGTSITLTTNYANSVILDAITSHSSSSAPTTTGSNSGIWTAVSFGPTTSAAGSQLNTTTAGMYTTSWSVTGANKTMVSEAIKASVASANGNFLTFM